MNSSTSTAGPTYPVLIESSYWRAIPRPPGSPPAVIPEGQEYYWTDEWQAGELESLAELQAGGGRVFESADEALRFLFRADAP